MSTPLLATKLHFPQVRPNLVFCLRLMAILEKGLCSPLTLISALAGSGKTTLMGEWRAREGDPTPIAWLLLDSADNDPFRFLTYLSAPVESTSPTLTHFIAPLLQSPQPQSPDLPAVFFGMWHYYGMSPGAGMIFPTFLGCVSAKAMVETKGFFWSWAVQVPLDFIVFSIYAVLFVS